MCMYVLLVPFVHHVCAWSLHKLDPLELELQEGASCYVGPLKEQLVLLMAATLRCWAVVSNSSQPHSHKDAQPML